MSLRLDEPFRWGGKIAPPSIMVPHEGMAVPVKAATGLERFFNGTKPMLIGDSPRKRMRECQALYWTHPWIRRAENLVTSKVAGLPWHVEDQNQDEIDDQTANPVLKAVRDLLEKPQAALDPRERQPGISTRRGLVSITSRHMGLCGLGYWFLDQMDQGGLPLAILYVNPARMTVRSTEAGALVGYSLDADDYGNGGTFFPPEQILPFYLDVPDAGGQVAGLVEAAALKARIVTASDLHHLSVLGSGGRIAGLVSPKEGYIDDPERFAQMERDFRNVNDAPDAAKRMTIIRGAMDFTKTAADPSELSLLDLSKTGRDDIYSIWGFPPSQAGVAQSRGLNSGESGAHEYEVLMTGPVHDRVVAIQETVQFDLLDRIAGVSPQLVIEEPSFDDDGPAYEIAAKAVPLPLTNNERRNLIGLDPLPEYGPDGEPLGVAIWVPININAMAQGAEEKSTPDNPFPNAPKPKPEPTPPQPTVEPVPPQAQLTDGKTPPMPMPMKASLRASIDKRVVPTIRKTVERFLSEQRDDILGRIRNASPRQLRDTSYWFRGDAWDRALTQALKPYIAAVAENVSSSLTDKYAGRVKADPFLDQVVAYVLRKTGLRIGGINETTREAIGDVVLAGLDESLTASEIADRVGELGVFNESRAEMIARTETAFAYNAAAISSYRELGVQEVTAIDGDGDPECADRDGKTFSVEEAQDIEDHPNGTLDWVPVFG